MAALNPTSSPYRISAGIGAGAGAAFVMLLVMGLLRLIFGLLTVPELLLNPILKLLGGRAFSDLLDRLYYTGRPLLFAVILEGALLLGVLLGLLYAAIARPNPETGARSLLFSGAWGGLLYGLVIGVLLNAVFLPLIGQPAFASAPVDIYSTSGFPLWLGMMLLAIVFGVVLHLLLPRTEGSPYAVSGDGDMEFDGGRRHTLRVMGGFLIALTGGALFTAGGTILAQGGLQSPVDPDNLANDPGSGTTAELIDEPPAATATLTRTSTPRPTATRTHTPTPTETSTPIPQPTDAPTFTPTETPTPEPPTATPLPPTETPTPLPTATPLPAINAVEITPVGSFYHVSKNFFDPEPDVTTWKLEVKGLVNTSYEMTYSNLTMLPSVEVVVGMMCISNPIGGDLIGNTKWRGVKLADLLARATPKKGAVDLILTAADGYQDSISLEKALDPDVVLVWEMDGQKLNFAHGYPARLLVPGIYGMKHVKWITSIELVDYNFKGFWQQPDQGWSEPAPVNTMSKISYPSAAKALAVGALHNLSGVAFAGDRSISRVEISTDNGTTWADAYIKPKLSETSWVVWGYDWYPAAKGKITVRVRATDGQGNVQTSKRTDPYPNGATGYHGVTYTVR